MEHKSSLDFKLEGRVRAILIRAKDYSIHDSGWIKNTITNAGKAQVAALIGGVSSDFFDYIAIGTSSTAPAATQTALGAETTTNGGGRAASTNTRVTTTVTNDTAQFAVTYTFSGTLTGIKETGIFSASSSGTMLARTLFTSTYDVDNGDVLNVIWQVKVS